LTRRERRDRYARGGRAKLVLMEVELLYFDGVDVDLCAGDRTDFGGRCRLYPAGERPRGAPPDEWVLRALRQAGHSAG
jgi:hypothetical protein